MASEPWGSSRHPGLCCTSSGCTSSFLRERGAGLSRPPPLRGGDGGDAWRGGRRAGPAGSAQQALADPAEVDGGCPITGDALTHIFKFASVLILFSLSGLSWEEQMQSVLGAGRGRQCRASTAQPTGLSLWTVVRVCCVLAAASLLVLAGLGDWD